MERGEIQFEIRPAGKEDVDTLVSIMEEDGKEKEHPDWFFPGDRAYVEEHIEKKGFTLIAWEQEGKEAAGFFIVDFPGESQENLGRDLGFSKEELVLVAHMDTAVVRRKFRGRGLQGKLLKSAEERLRAFPFRYYLCTVHPENKASLKTMKKGGYQTAKTKEKYGGLMRHILVKDSWEEEVL